MTRGCRVSSVAVCAALVLLLASAGAAAAGKGKGKAEQIRDYLDRATAAFALNHFADAADNYEKAFALKPDAAVLYNAAQAHRLAAARSARWSCTRATCGSTAPRSGPRSNGTSRT
jgi:hypothetical protein